MSDHLINPGLADQGRPLSLFATIEANEPEIAERLAARHAEIRQGASTSSAVTAALALGAAPIALAALARDAYGQLPSIVIGVLNFALALEHLESSFYDQGVASGNIPSSDLTIFTTIKGHEDQHVTALTGLLGKSARPAPTFDFTAGGKFPNPFAAGNYAVFQALAQAFEDTGVRAYKGQATALMPYPSVLTTALGIHSVEARHASEVRRLRGNFSEMAPHKGWITGNMTDIPGTAPVYAGEDNTNQGGVNVSTLPGANMTAATEAFDEPLTMAQVLAIAGLFVGSSPT